MFLDFHVVLNAAVRCSACSRALCGEMHKEGPCPWPDCAHHDPATYAKFCQHRQAISQRESDRFIESHGIKRSRAEAFSASNSDVLVYSDQSIISAQSQNQQPQA